jgi:hypothetical protein
MEYETDATLTFELSLFAPHAGPADSLALPVSK